MKILVTGALGQLGRDVMDDLAARGHEGIGTDILPTANGVSFDYIGMDITDGKGVLDTIRKVQPDAVIHCAAWTNVDGAEDKENRDKVMAINWKGTEHIAEACADAGCKMVYLSTDYVFGGEGTAPWQPDDIAFAPLNVYGQSKLMGEEAVRKLVKQFFVVRTAWVFGLGGKNFIDTMLKLSDKHETLRVVSDQVGTPTYTVDLARLLVDMAESERYGNYHATNEGGFISWYDFACEIFKVAGKTVNVVPVTTSEYGLSKAARPFNSRLDKGKLRDNGFTPLPDWRDALKRYLEDRQRHT